MSLSHQSGQLCDQAVQLSLNRLYFFPHEFHVDRVFPPLLVSIMWSKCAAASSPPASEPKIAAEPVLKPEFIVNQCVRYFQNFEAHLFQDSTLLFVLAR